MEQKAEVLRAEWLESGRESWRFRGNFTTTCCAGHGSPSGLTASETPCSVSAGRMPPHHLKPLSRFHGKVAPLSEGPQGSSVPWRVRGPPRRQGMKGMQ